MEVRDLQVFLSVAKHLNPTRAGHEAYLTRVQKKGITNENHFQG